MRRWKFWASTEEVAASEMESARSLARCRGVESMKRGEKVEMYGEIHSLSSSCPNDTPSLKAVIQDDTGRIEVIWLGRRRVAGVKLGQRVRIKGRLTLVDNQKTIYNPEYTLEA